MISFLMFNSVYSAQILYTLNSQQFNVTDLVSKSDCFKMQLINVIENNICDTLLVQREHGSKL